MTIPEKKPVVVGGGGRPPLGEQLSQLLNRLAAACGSQKAAALELGWTEAKYSRYLNGQTPATEKLVQEVREALYRKITEQVGRILEAYRKLPPAARALVIKQLEADSDLPPDVIAEFTTKLLEARYQPSTTSADDDDASANGVGANGHPEERPS